MLCGCPRLSPDIHSPCTVSYSALHSRSMPCRVRNVCISELLALLCLLVTGCGGGSQQATQPGGPGSPTALNFAARVDIDSGGNMDTGGFHSGSLAVGDFNGDGSPDIAVSNELSNTISVFLNDANGAFGQPIITPVQISALNVGPIAAGDVNEDGRSDLVLGTIAGLQANIVLLSNGTGSFTQLPPIPNSF